MSQTGNSGGDSKFLNPKRVSRGFNKKNQEYLKVAFDPDTAAALIEKISAHGDNPRGVNLTITVYERESANGTFETGYVIVDGIQDPSTFKRGGTPSRFNRVGASSSGDVKAKVAALKTGSK